METEVGVARSRPPGARRRARVVVAGVVLAALALVLLSGLRRSRELEVAVSVEGEPFIQGRPIPLRLAVRNVSGHPVEVNAWEPVDPEECRVLEGKPFTISLFEEPLPEPVLHLPYGLGQPVPRRTLEPDEEIELRCDVGQLFGLYRVDSYVLEITYLRDPWARHPWLSLPARLWSSAVPLGRVPIEVVPRYR